MVRAVQARCAQSPQQGSARLDWAVSRARGQKSSVDFAGARLDEPSGHEAFEDQGSHLSHHFGRLTIFPSIPRGSLPYRSQMERHFASDFSRVSVLRGASALLKPFGARAAAWPETIAFESNSPSPLMVAHELTHILQYRHGPQSTLRCGGSVSRGHAAEAEARAASRRVEAGMPVRAQARPPTMPMLYTDEEDLDSEEFLQDRPPQFTNEEIGTWGNVWPATLIARERLQISFPEAERSHAIVQAIAERAPIVILHEYGRLWLYRLEWEGLSARYSRFTNAETIFHEGTNERGDYSISNVQGRPEVEAFVTEDGGVLSPPGAGTLFSHTGGAFEDQLVSKFQNARAFLTGLQKGLEGANFPGLAQRLRNMAALNTVFPAPFAIGALQGMANEVLDLMQWLNPQQWKAVEAAARQAILMLNDPDGEEVAATLGEEFGRSQASALETLLERSLPVFAYEVGKLIGPTIIETVLAFIGIEVGPLAMIQRTLEAVGETPRLVGVLRRAQRVFPEIPDRPGFAKRLEGEGVVFTEALAETLPEPGRLPSLTPSPSLPDLSPSERELLVRTGNAAEFAGELPKELADQEVEIVKRARKVGIAEGDGKYINEVDLGNGHKWKEQRNGTWCRFSSAPTNCTVLIEKPGPVDIPGTIVALASSRKELMEVYAAWAGNRSAEDIEVAIIKCIENTDAHAAGTYAVVVGTKEGVKHPPGLWITVAHTHPGVPGQAGFKNPSAADLQWAEYDALEMLEKETGGVRKWVHSETMEGEWQSVAYGYDVEARKFFVEPPVGEPLYFEKLHAPEVNQIDLNRYDQLARQGRHRERIEMMMSQNSEAYYLGWYARQFTFTSE